MVTADRLILRVTDEQGFNVTCEGLGEFAPAEHPEQPRFVPAGLLNGLRREAAERLEAARIDGWQRPARRVAMREAVYPAKRLNYLGNALNQAAVAFFQEHGVGRVAPAYEAGEEQGEAVLMITKHCIRFSQHLCHKQNPEIKPEPLELKMGKDTFRLRFDCVRCEMQVLGSLKP
ncbi:DUF3656 domain-containing protein [Aeromonas schubertii]|uniref:Peptidase U32 family protein n=1 Tax=Aeromonas schubertii TaxID=652 RepID=A0A0S2SLB3_9GAMM|nr:hypothetical protein [Aeromonas schubertii]ALP42519.1 peptidase U32 family protein [Aeromonas schubertii]